MARSMKTDKTADSASVKKQPTAAEMREWYAQNQDRVERFETAVDALKQLRDITKSSTKSISTFNKETLRTYLRNIGSNEKNLRNLSRYLKYRSQVYYRLIMYNATMFCLNARSVIPSYSLIEENNDDEILQSYYDTLVMLDHMNLQYEFEKAYATCFTEDVFYGCCYYDETGFFILPLDPDYCKISHIYDTGDFGFAMDMSYFRSKQELMESWGEPFTSLYKEYEKTGQKWQIFTEDYAVCLKARAEDWETVVPPFSGIFNSLLSLLDLEDIQAIADEQQIYRLIWMEMETLGKDVDDWKVNPKIVSQYFNKMLEEALPEYTTAALVPAKLHEISFDNDQAVDTTKVEKATQTVLNTSGGSQILNSATISGTTAFEASVKSDTEFAISMLLPQTQAWLNRFLTYYITNPARVKFFEVSVYTKDKLKESMLVDSQHGLPSKLAIKTLDGFSELDVLALNHLEEDILKVSDKFVPLSSSYTISKESQGRPAGEPTDDSEESAERRDTAKG